MKFYLQNLLPIKLLICRGRRLRELFPSKSYTEKAKQETFRIKKVLRRDNKKKLALVKWGGYPDKFNSWVSFSNLVNF